MLMFELDMQHIRLSIGALCFFFLGGGRFVKYVTFYQVHALKGAVIYKVVTRRHYHTGRQSSRSVNISSR